MTLSTPKGTYDLLPIEDKKDPWKNTKYWQWLEERIRLITSRYAIDEIRTPIFEKTELFARGVGEGTDIVSKEMYTFMDKGNRSLTLRPEGTACVMRSLIEKNLYHQYSLLKLYYIGPMFRYERPQAGRFRQHMQFGVEVVGSSSPYQDAELIDLVYNLYSDLGLKNLTLHLNSVGTSECRANYKKALIDFLTPHENSLSEDSQRRLKTNPLRILDSKSPQDQDILKQAPCILDFLSPEAKNHFEKTQEALNILNIPVCITPTLVRGLDYYNHTVFEITSGNLGAQNSIGGGGRYDGLIKTLGGSHIPAVGFATGMERILQAMLEQDLLPSLDSSLDVCLIPIGEEAKKHSFLMLKELRKQGINAAMELQEKKLKQSMKWANETGARFVIVLGDEELNSNTINIKEMATGQEEKVAQDNLCQWFSLKSTKE
jgi:histidyl-tRNA synthetase